MSFNKRKSFSIILAGILMLTMLVGCSTTNGGSTVTPTTAVQPTAAPVSEVSDSPWISDDPITVNMMIADQQAIPFTENWPSFQEIKKLTNVNLAVQAVPQADYETKVKMVISSGEMPDFMTNITPKIYNQFAADSVFLPVSDYYDKLTNFSKLIDEWNLDFEIKQLSMIDEKVYMLPSIEEKAMQTIAFLIRSDLVKEYGFETPKTLDDLYVFLKKVKEMNPSSIPYTNKYGLELCIRGFAGSFGMSDQDASLLMYDDAADSWKIGVTTDNYKEMLLYLNKLYTEGLWDPEIPIQDTKQFEQKVTTGLSVASWDYYSKAAQYTVTGKKQVGEEFTMTPILPVSGKDGKAGVPAKERYVSGAVLNPKLDKDENFEKKLKFIDWLLYGNELFSWGIEGTTYEVVNNQKKILPGIKTFVRTEGDKHIQTDFGLYTNAFNYTRPWDYVNEVYMDDDGKEYFNTLYEKNMVPKTQPSIKLSSDDAEQVNILKTNLATYTDEMILKFILGNVSVDSYWNTFVKECESKGGSQLIKIYNDAWNKQK